MSTQHREMFQMIKSEDIHRKLHQFIDTQFLPSHLGGTSMSYTSQVVIQFEKKYKK